MELNHFLNFLDEGLVLKRVRPGSKIESTTETTATHLQVGYVGQDNVVGNDNNRLLMGDVEHLGDGDSRKTDPVVGYKLVYGF